MAWEVGLAAALLGWPEHLAIVIIEGSNSVSIGFEGSKRATPYDPDRDRCQYQLWRPVQRKVLIPALEESLRSQRTLG